MHTPPSRQPLLQQIIATETDIVIDRLWREEGIAVSACMRRHWEGFIMHRVCSALHHSLEGHETSAQVIDHAIAHALAALIAKRREQEGRTGVSAHCRLIAAVWAFWDTLVEPRPCRR